MQLDDATRDYLVLNKAILQPDIVGPTVNSGSRPPVTLWKRILLYTEEHSSTVTRSAVLSVALAVWGLVSGTSAVAAKDWVVAGLSGITVLVSGVLAIVAFAALAARGRATPTRKG